MDLRNARPESARIDTIIIRLFPCDQESIGVQKTEPIILGEHFRNLIDLFSVQG